MKDKISIIGTGISGLSISRILNEQNKFDVSLFEKKSTIGGLIKCDKVEGNLFHRVGGHLFNSKDKTVLDWFWNHFDKENEFVHAKRNAKILFNDKIIGYPIENYLFQLEEQEIKSVVNDLIELLKNQGETPVYNNFKEYLIGNFGITLFNLYFGPYNSKIWNFDISKVPLAWLDGKLPMPKIEEIILNNIVKKEESEMVHSSFYYPKINGSQFIADRLAENQEVNTEFELVDLKIGEEGLITINNNIKSKYLIYTGDIRILYKIVHIDDVSLLKSLEDVVNLKSNGTSNVLCETDRNDISWLYLPEDKYKSHRIIYTGNFSESNNSSTERMSCVVEFSGKHDKETIIDELKKLPGNLKPIEFNYEPNSYIIQEKDTREKIKKVKTELEKYNIFLLGRFAEWEYYNMDKCIESALQLSKIIIDKN